MMTILSFRTIEPLHVGSGRGVGKIDLPVAREAATGWPLVPGSSVKGALRDAFGTLLGEQNPEFLSLFGSPVADSDDPKAGALSPPECNLTLMPIASLYGGFAWATSPLALRRLNDLLQLSGQESIPIPKLANRSDTAISKDSSLIDRSGKVQLLDLRLNRQQNNELENTITTLSKLAGLDSKELALNLAVVDDAIFRHLTHAGAQVMTKVTLEKGKKTAKQGGLRTEEAVPVDALFTGLLRFQRIRKDEDPLALGQAFLRNLPPVMQFGGKSSTGHGLCQVFTPFAQ